MNLFKTIWTLVFSFTLFISIAQQTRPIPLDPAVRYGKLKNGLTYYIRRNEVPEKRALFYLVTKVGSVQEDEDQKGIAHFLEHMNFNGLEHFPQNELVNYLQLAGVRFGADLNAHTSYSETVYKLPVPTDNKKVFNNAFYVIRDWAQAATLDSLEIEKERGVVLEELRSRKGVLTRMRDQYLPLLYRGSRYEKNNVIGSEESLKSFKHDALRRFHKDWYRPNLQAVIVVGDVDESEVEQKISRLFDDLKNPSQERPYVNYPTSLDGSNGFLALNDKENTNTSALIYIKHLVSPQKTEADYTNMMVRELIRGMLSERFRQLSLAGDPGFRSASAMITNIGGNLDAFYLGVNANGGGLEKAIKSAWKEIVKIKRYGFREDEFMLQKNRYGGSRNYRFREREKAPSIDYVNTYVDHFTKGDAAPGIEIENEYVRRYLRFITLKNVNDLFEQYVTDFNRDIVLSAPAGVALPDEARVNRWLADVQSDDITEELVLSESKPLMKQRPEKAKIVSEKEDKKADVTELVFENGLKVLLKPTEFKNNIIFSAFANGGTSVYPDADYPSAYFSEQMVTNSGLSDFPPVDFSRYLNKHPVNIRASIREKTQGFSGSCAQSQLENLFQVLHLYFTAPRLDSAVFNSQLDKYRQYLSTRSNNPNSEFGDTINKVQSNDSKRNKPLTLADLQTVKPEKVLRVFKERFADASAFTFTFVGNFSVREMKPMLQRYLGSLPSIYRKERSMDRTAPASGIIKRTVYRGQEEKANVKLVYSEVFEKKDDANQEMDALAAIIRTKLMEQLREESGGVYSVNASSTRSSGWGKFTIEFNCAPANVEKLIRETNLVVDQLKKEGPLEKDIKKYKVQYQLQEELRLKDNQFWLNYLEAQARANKPYSEVYDYLKRVEGLDNERLKTCAARYLNGKNYLQFVLMPESAAIGKVGMTK